MKIKELSSYDKPYEKAKIFGVDNLSDKELLAIILRSGTIDLSSLDLAEKLLLFKSEVTGIANLNKLSFSELVSIKGIGDVKAIQILSVVELSKRLSRTRYPEKVYFNSPKTTANYFMEYMRHLSHEEMKLLCLDIKGSLLRSITIFKRSVSSCTVSAREIFLEALKWNAARIILLHNHPSGDSSPSSEDISFTKVIDKIGKELGIVLLDHIIIGDLNFYSLKENMKF